MVTEKLNVQISK